MERTHLLTSSFQDFGLAEPISRALKEENYLTPTPIQAQTIPLAMTGRDIVGIAQTGTGKTAAFALPILHRILENRIRVQPKTCRVLVLSPTRELSGQILESFNAYGRHIRLSSALAIGGVPMGRQVRSVMQGVEVMVATPGRLLDLVQSNGLKLGQVEFLVLDEADRMLDMGFYDSIEEIIAQSPERRQTLLFSATYPTGIKQLAAKFMRNPQIVKAEAFHDDTQIEQRFYEISPEERMDAVVKVLAHHRPASCVAFCFTKQQVQETVDHLTSKGISAVGLHGDLEQRDRDQVLAMFANRSTSVLVATDVAARGLDIDALDMVINVELARDSEIHIHRVGRTGRAGEKGIAISLVAPSEAHRAQAIELLQKSPLSWDQLDNLKSQGGAPLLPVMSTLVIGAGRKDKVRPGDILGALTGDAGIPGAQVGKIAIFDFQAYVAVERGIAKQALQRLNDGKIKGRSLRVRIL